jgi:transporter family protein
VKREFVAGYLLALGAATAYGINAVVIREGVQRFGVALPGLAVAMLVALLSMGLVSLRQRPPRGPFPGRAFLFIVLSGLCSSVGIGSYFLALSQFPISLVVPISSIYPLVTLVLARLFLQQSERITWRAGLGAAFVVAGVILVALSR